MQICFIDNSSEYASYIEQGTGWSVTQVCSENELEAIVKQSFDVWFIGLSLNWNKHNYSKFSGFGLINRLRTEYKISAPFVCFSFMPEQWFEEQNNDDYNVLKWFGHSYLQLPFTPIQALEIVKQCDPVLTELHLAELAYSCYTPIGIVEELFHHLRNQTQNREVFISNAQIAQNKICKRVNVTDIPYIEATFKTLIEKAQTIDITVNTYTQIPTITELSKNVVKGFSQNDVNRAKEDIQKLFKDSTTILPFGMPDWYVLFVDDEKHIQENVQNKLQKYGLKCIVKSSYTEACEILNLDGKGNWVHEGIKMPPNTITVLISDLRFIERKRVVYHQGYQLLMDIFNQKLKGSNRPINYGCLSMFLLTSNSGALERIMNTRSPYKAFHYDKEILDIERVFIRFAFQVFEEGTRIWSAVHQKASGVYWTRSYANKIKPSLEYFYFLHRMSADYDKNEVYIAHEAKSFVNEALDVRSFQEAQKSKLKPGEKEIFRKVPWHHQFTSQVNLSSKEAMENLFIKLICRRIAFALYLSGIEPQLIAGLLINSTYKRELNDQVFCTHLAMASDIKSDISNNLLVEEINWLQENNFLK